MPMRAPISLSWISKRNDDGFQLQSSLLGPKRGVPKRLLVQFFELWRNSLKSTNCRPPPVAGQIRRSGSPLGFWDPLYSGVGVLRRTGVRNGFYRRAM
jgi:hypothetical protein